MKRFTLLLAMAMVMATSVVAWGRINILTNSTAMYAPMYSLQDKDAITKEMRKDMGIIVFYCSNKPSAGRYYICAKSENDKCTESKVLLQEIKKFQKKWDWKQVEFVDVSKPFDRRFNEFVKRFNVGFLPDIWIVVKDRQHNVIYEQRLAQGAVSADAIADAIIKMYWETR